MSMIDQLARAVRTAVDKDMTPVEISLAPEDAREMVLQVRQEDPERKGAMTVPINNWPHIWNPRDKKFSPLYPKEWTYDDTELGIKLTIPISVDRNVRRGGFHMTTKAEAPKREKTVSPRKLLEEKQIAEEDILAKDSVVE